MRSTGAPYLALLPPVEGGVIAPSSQLLQLHPDKHLRGTPRGTGRPPPMDQGPNKEVNLLCLLDVPRLTNLKTD